MKTLIVLTKNKMEGVSFVKRLPNVESYHSVVYPQLPHDVHEINPACTHVNIVVLGWEQFTHGGAICGEIGRNWPRNASLNFCVDEHPDVSDSIGWNYINTLAKRVGLPEGNRIQFAHELIENEDDWTDEEWAMTNAAALTAKALRHSAQLSVAISYKGDVEKLTLSRECIDSTLDLKGFLAHKRRAFRSLKPRATMGHRIEARQSDQQRASVSVPSHAEYTNEAVIPKGGFTLSKALRDRMSKSITDAMSCRAREAFGGGAQFDNTEVLMKEPADDTVKMGTVSQYDRVMKSTFGSVVKPKDNDLRKLGSDHVIPDPKNPWGHVARNNLGNGISKFQEAKHRAIKKKLYPEKKVSPTAHANLGIEINNFK